MQTIIETALNFEKNTLLIYQELRDLFSYAEGSIINKICNEEKKHIQRIMDFKIAHFS